MAQTERKQGHVRSASEHVYSDAPVTIEDLVNAIGVSVEELHDWLSRDRGLLALLKERNIQPEGLVEALINVAASRLRDSARGDISTEQVEKVLAALRHRLIADLDLTHKARPRVSEERPQARPVSFVPFDIRVISRALKIEVTELRRMLESGHTIQEIAQARGVSLEQVLRAVVEILELELRKAVQDGRINEEDARKKLANAEESLRKALQSFRMARRSDEHRDEDQSRPELRPTSDGANVTVEINAQTVARVLGITSEQLHTLITEGVTLPEIARRRGVTLENLVKVLLAPVRGQLDAALKSGNISEETFKRQLTGAREAIVQALEELVRAQRQATQEGRSTDSSTSTESSGSHEQTTTEGTTSDSQERPATTDVQTRAEETPTPSAEEDTETASSTY